MQDIPRTIICGAYLIVCTATGEMYVGGSVNILQRWRQHRNVLRKGSSNSPRLQAAWDKYPGKISFAILQECPEGDLCAVEQGWIDRLQPALNTNPRAGTGAGRKMTEEQLARMRLRPQSTAKTHTFRGEQKTAFQIAQLTGLSVVGVRARMRNGVDLERPSQKGPASPVSIGTEQLTPRQIAEKFDLPLTTVYSRLGRGWSGAALTAPRKHRARNSH